MRTCLFLILNNKDWIYTWWYGDVMLDSIWCLSHHMNSHMNCRMRWQEICRWGSWPEHGTFPWELKNGYTMVHGNLKNASQRGFSYWVWPKRWVHGPSESMPDVGVLGEDGLDLLEQCLNYKAPQLGEGGYLDVLSGCRLDCSEF